MKKNILFLSLMLKIEENKPVNVFGLTSYHNTASRNQAEHNIKDKKLRKSYIVLKML
ncbi:MAG: hypothetical protein ACXVJD_12070 [Mucilaginibacter sp.]